MTVLDVALVLAPLAGCLLMANDFPEVAPFSPATSGYCLATLPGCMAVQLLSIISH
jgi:hypothetical protein